jgi:hypothetical protein
MATTALKRSGTKKPAGLRALRETSRLSWLKRQQYYATACGRVAPARP